MSSKTPEIRQAAGISVLPKLLFMVLRIFIASLFVESLMSALYIGLLAYLIMLLALRHAIPQNHRKGISLVRTGNYRSAIDEFQKSYDFFAKHPWLDKYRFITLLSSGRISYTEMALVNIAFCHSQTNSGKLAKQYYEKTLELFPDSRMAITSLNIITAAENNVLESIDVL